MLFLLLLRHPHVCRRAVLSCVCVLPMCVVSPPQALSKRLLGGSGSITCIAVHPSGDHVLAGAEDKRLAW